MQQLRLFIKKYFPKFYHIIRTTVSPIYFKLRTNKLNKFTSKEIKQISYANQEFFITLDPENGFVDAEIYSTGIYEPEILSLIKKHLPNNGTFVDIGSNIGQHALFAASIVGPSGIIIAFEPIPKLVLQLKESIEINGYSNFFYLHPIACGDSYSTEILHINKNNIGGSSIYNKKSDSSEITIEIEPADKYTENLPKIDLIKIDTEGYELETLNGLEKTLTKHKPKIIIEFSPNLHRNATEYKDNFFKILNKLNYLIYDIEDSEIIVKDIEKWTKNFTKTQTNLLCLPK